MADSETANFAPDTPFMIQGRSVTSSGTDRCVSILDADGVVILPFSGVVQVIVGSQSPQFVFSLHYSISLSSVELAA
jgi:hypothetical protein